MLKHPFDLRDYLCNSLDNSLKYIAINDKSAKMSHVSLVLNSGSFNDISPHFGLAHLFEHLIYSTPISNYKNFASYMGEIGGYFNASTELQFTTFCFSVNNKYLEKSLKIFALLFYKTQFCETVIKEEIKTIEEEFASNTEDEITAILNTQKILINPKHPFANFAHGNKNTLKNIKKLKHNLNEYLNSYVVAQNMSLVVATNKPILKIQEFIENSFSIFDNKKPKNFLITEPLYTLDNVQNYLEIESKKEINKLTISFEIPQRIDFYKNKLSLYIAGCLNFSEENSFIDFLKNQNFISNCFIGQGIVTKKSRLFNIDLFLKTNKKNDENKIIFEVFNYLNQSKQELVKNWRYLEKEKIMNNNFAKTRNITSLEFTNRLAVNMQKYEQEDYIFGDYCMQGFFENEFNLIYQNFKLENARFIKTSNQIKAKNTSNYYKTPYNLKTFSLKHTPSFLKQNYSFAKKNQYLPNYVYTKTKIDNTPPSLLKNNSFFKLWQKEIVFENIAQNTIYINFENSKVANEKDSFLILKSLVQIFISRLESYVNTAQEAGLFYDFFENKTGFTLCISGFSAKQESFLKHIIKTIFTIKINSFDLDKSKEKLKKYLVYKKNKNSIVRIISELTKILSNSNQQEDLSKNFLHLNLLQIQAFKEKLFKTFSIKILVCGSYKKQQSIKISDWLSNLIFKKAKARTTKKYQFLKLSKNFNLYKKLDSDDSSNIALKYIQGIDNSRKSYLLLAVFSQILSENFFYQFRVKEKISYRLSANFYPLINIPGVVFYIQSKTQKTNILLEKIDNFLNDFLKQIDLISEKKFLECKNLILNNLQKKNTDLESYSQNLWNKINLQEHDFGSVKTKKELLLNLELDELKKYAKLYLDPKYNRAIYLGKGEKDLNNYLKNSKEITAENLDLLEKFEI